MNSTSMRTRILSAIGFGGVLATVAAPGCGGKSLESADETAGSGGQAGSGGTSGVGGTGGIDPYGGSGGTSGTGGVGNYGGTGGWTAGTGGIAGSTGGTGGASCSQVQYPCYPPEIYESWGVAGSAGAAGDLGLSGAPAVHCPSETLRPLGSPCLSNYGTPHPLGTSCCYPTLVNQCCLQGTGGTGVGGFGGVGRPFMVDGAARVAPLAERIDWGSALDAAAEPAERARVLAELWQRDARLEHASVASFARLSLQLLELGAPPDLVEDVHRAALDEIAHARSCFALSARYAGAPVGPGPLATRDALAAASFEEVAVAAVIEGCIGETVAALLAQVQGAGARDRAVQGALSRIAEDEAAHAELSWRIVRWAVSSGGAGVRSAVGAAFERGVRELRASEPAVDALPEDVLNAHGRLTARQTRDVSLRALAEVIEPCAWALLEPGAAGAAHVATA